MTLAGKSIAPCDGCLSCERTRECHIKDDMQDIYTKLLEADGIIFATPVYFWTVSAQAKTLIDRTYVFTEARNLRNKVAGVIVTTGRRGSMSAFSVFSNFFNGQRMIMVGVAMGFGSRSKEEVKNDKRGMAEARALGKAIIRRIQSYEIQNSSQMTLSTTHGEQV